MQPRLKKYIPLLCLLVLVVLSWLEEIVIGEGGYHLYLLQPEHKLLRFLLRGGFVFIIFLIGYIGLKSMAIRWLVVLWIGLYVLALISGVIRVTVDLFWHSLFIGNSWSFLSSLYYYVFSPFPYAFLYLLALVAKKDLLRKP